MPRVSLRGGLGLAGVELPEAEVRAGGVSGGDGGGDVYRSDGGFDGSMAPVRRLAGDACVLSPLELRALELRRQPYSLPETVALGTGTIHRYREGHIDVTISAFLPVGTAEFPGVLLDLNRKQYFETIPDRAILSDFGPRPFIGIDKREGTPLDRWLNKIIACMPRGANGYELESTLEYLRTRLHDILPGRPEPSAFDAANCPWDQLLTLTPQAENAFRAANMRGIDDAPLNTDMNVPVVPFEKYLDAQRGACLQKALLATMILERLGFGCRLVNGAVDFGLASSGGHAWVELRDGRILCPTWQLLEYPRPSVNYPGEFQLGNSLLFESQRSPYLRD